ncbi:glycerophosphodiester phosphodiesterase [Candidatus Woesearchaeota archaeon CG_4_10_14_0_2_um_filter_33_13]|nr:MAG: glycerophosphodiester phosphodiesterase [Candidatus Woesearchaeota archaeon CG_4_10_14_0_2_um_filter_33_13]
MLKIGHRGAAGYEPENTLRSFKKALDLKVEMIELDVHLSKDQKLVVIHDNSAKRTTNGKGWIKNLTFEELRKFDAGKEEKIPLLEEVLDLVNKKVMINIELKGDNTAKPVANLIKKYEKKGWSKNNFQVSSFKFNELEDFFKLNKKVNIGVLFEHFPNRYLKKAKTINAYSINPPVKFATSEFVKKAHTLGLKVLVWTVNEKSQIEQLKKLGVDGIFSNFPDRI